jgi:hypothetical protein
MFKQQWCVYGKILKLTVGKPWSLNALRTSGFFSNLFSDSSAPWASRVQVKCSDFFRSW